MFSIRQEYELNHNRFDQRGKKIPPDNTAASLLYQPLPHLNSPQRTGFSVFRQADMHLEPGAQGPGDERMKYPPFARRLRAVRQMGVFLVGGYQPSTMKG